MRPMTAIPIGLALLASQAGSAATVRWTSAEASRWYAHQSPLIGSNYTPASAINQLEMWQADSFDPERIDKELGWAERLGMNTMRVFLQDQLWKQDAPDFTRRINTFLTIAARHHIKPLFVLFDSCWDPVPKLGPQHPPIPGVHNSGWAQSPGAVKLRDPRRYPELQGYVKGVVGAFRRDDRILGWDVWNEPDNDGGGDYPRTPDKTRLIAALLPQVFAWARSVDPVQPLTSGVWHDDDDWANSEKLNEAERIQLGQSDVISFHDYSWPEVFEARVNQLLAYRRPILCTEFMARGNGSTFDGSLPVAERYNVGMINWGFVDGKTQTRLPWDSWARPYTSAPPTQWFHEVLRSDGSPYRTREAELIQAFASGSK